MVNIQLTILMVKYIMNTLFKGEFIAYRYFDKEGRH